MRSNTASNRSDDDDLERIIGREDIIETCKKREIGRKRLRSSAG